MNLFNMLGNSVKWVTQGAQQTIDRLTGVEAARKQAKAETNRLKRKLQEVQQHIQQSRAKQAATTRTSE